MSFKSVVIGSLFGVVFFFSGCCSTCNATQSRINCNQNCANRYHECVNQCNNNYECVQVCKNECPSVDNSCFAKVNYNNTDCRVNNSCNQPKPAAYVAPQPNPDEFIIQNSPVLPANRIITIAAVGMGVAPVNTISPAQAIALAKRAAIVDAYRQLGEKMYGIRINATDTIGDMVAKNSKVKTKVLAVIKNAEIIETTMQDGLCQVKMEVKLDGRLWNYILSGVAI